MNFTYFGHSCFLIEFNGKKLLFDPFISGNPIAQEISADHIEADYILLTHGHGDHVMDAEAIARRCDATILTNFEISEWCTAKGLKTIGLNQGGKTKLDFGTVKYVTAIHSSSLPDGSYAGNPGGFVIWDNKSCFYHAGDTALTMDMKLIPLTCPKLDFAILPIGDYFTMGYEDAALAAEFIQCDQIIGSHFDTFPPVTINQEAASLYFSERNLSLYLPKIGDEVKLR
jgi:L-ascorbate metabolism protein UlaG (beta-lactamase superfamily)